MLTTLYQMEEVPLKTAAAIKNKTQDSTLALPKGSIISGGKVLPMPEEKDKGIVPILSLKVVPSREREQLDSLCTEIAELAESISALEAMRKKALEKVEKLADKYKLERVKVKGLNWSLSCVPGSRSDIIPELLASQGVPLKVIEKATKVKTWVKWQVRRDHPGKKKEGEE